MDSEKITVKYFAKSQFFKELYQATEDSGEYDLFDADTLTLFPKNNGCVSLAGISQNPKRILWKKFFLGLVF